MESGASEIGGGIAYGNEERQLEKVFFVEEISGGVGLSGGDSDQEGDG